MLCHFSRSIKLIREDRMISKSNSSSLLFWWTTMTQESHELIVVFQQGLVHTHTRELIIQFFCMNMLCCSFSVPNIREVFRLFEFALRIHCLAGHDIQHEIFDHQVGNGKQAQRSHQLQIKSYGEFKKKKISNQTSNKPIISLNGVPESSTLEN